MVEFQSRGVFAAKADRDVDARGVEIIEGGRVSAIDNTLWPDGEDQPCATVRVMLSRARCGGIWLAEPESDPRG
jgi:hypothetical protein